MQFLNFISTIDRLNKISQDILKNELNNLDYNDINAIQAILLNYIADKEIPFRQLCKSNLSKGSNISYNMKKLESLNYIQQVKNQNDKRSIIVTLTDKGKNFVASFRESIKENLQKTFDDKLESNDLNNISNTLIDMEYYLTKTLLFTD